jgi:hypothetical protein
MQLANLPPARYRHILEFDTSTIDRKVGLQIAGMLGLDILRPTTVHLDYRDGLVKFEPVIEKEEITPFTKGLSRTRQVN